MCSANSIVSLSSVWKLWCYLSSSIKNSYFEELFEDLSQGERQYFAQRSLTLLPTWQPWESHFHLTDAGRLRLWTSTEIWLKHWKTKLYIVLFFTSHNSKYGFLCFFCFFLEQKEDLSFLFAVLWNFFIFTFKNPMEGWIGKAQRIFRVVKILCMILKWWIHVIIHLSKPTKCTTPRKNPGVNYGHWVMMCQCQFIDCNRCTTLLGDDAIGGS